jgi:probable rRNA maturation factor
MADPGPSPTGTAHRAQAALTVEVLRKSDLWNRVGASDAMLARAATAAFAAAQGDGICEVTIVLADDAEQRGLNHKWRGKDRPTNVLSFPAGPESGAPAAAPRPLGDVVLACETVLKEALADGIAPANHTMHLVVHGVLHLLGHEHDDAAEADRMEALERTVLASFGVADPYAEAGEPAAAEVHR